MSKSGSSRTNGSSSGRRERPRGRKNAICGRKLRRIYESRRKIGKIGRESWKRKASEKSDRKPSWL